MDGRYELFHKAPGSTTAILNANSITSLFPRRCLKVMGRQGIELQGIEKRRTPTATLKNGRPVLQPPILIQIEFTANDHR